MNYARVDLHLHLDGSLYLPLAHKAAIKSGVVKPDCTFEEYYDLNDITKAKSAAEAIKMFDFPLAVLQTEDQIIEGVYHLVKRLEQQELFYAEIRYAPQLHTRGKLTQYEACKAVIAGVKKAKEDFPNVEVRIINCMMHEGPDANFNMAENMETIEITRKIMFEENEEILVALDLAGYENNGDFKLFAPLFVKAREYGIPYTIHAGEMGYGEHVVDAINMGAYRIGHGIQCVQNKEWLDLVVKTQIPLEVCLTSNAGGKEYGRHPIRELVAAGAKVTLNTDNLTYSKNSLFGEYVQAGNLGFDEATLKQFALNTIDAAFCKEDVKARIRKKIEEL